ncbi:hypothetical protein FOA52_015968 [Chlamydomonas sp. UWO 241]|nr:hypothetical protein FOA52_015968 [Chlamydomonas sp. UWO 241]
MTSHACPSAELHEPLLLSLQQHTLLGYGTEQQGVQQDSPTITEEEATPPSLRVTKGVDVSRSDDSDADDTKECDTATSTLLDRFQLSCQELPAPPAMNEEPVGTMGASVLPQGSTEEQQQQQEEMEMESCLLLRAARALGSVLTRCCRLSTGDVFRSVPGGWKLSIATFSGALAWQSTSVFLMLLGVPPGGAVRAPLVEDALGTLGDRSSTQQAATRTFWDSMRPTDLSINNSMMPANARPLRRLSAALPCGDVHHQLCVFARGSRATTQQREVQRTVDKSVAVAAQQRRAAEAIPQQRHAAAVWAPVLPVLLVLLCRRSAEERLKAANMAYEQAAEESAAEERLDACVQRLVAAAERRADTSRAAAVAAAEGRLAAASAVAEAERLQALASACPASRNSPTAPGSFASSAATSGGGDLPQPAATAAAQPAVDQLQERHRTTPLSISRIVQENCSSGSSEESPSPAPPQREATAVAASAANAGDSSGDDFGASTDGSSGGSAAAGPADTTHGHAQSGAAHCYSATAAAAAAGEGAGTAAAAASSADGAAPTVLTQCSIAASLQQTGVRIIQESQLKERRKIGEGGSGKVDEFTFWLGTNLFKLAFKYSGSKKQDLVLSRTLRLLDEALTMIHIERSDVDSSTVMRVVALVESSTPGRGYPAVWIDQAGTAHERWLLGFVMEHMSCNMDQLLTTRAEEGRLFSALETLRLMHSVAHGVKAITWAGGSHLDIKLANVFVDEDAMVAKVGDMGLARVTGTEVYGGLGSQCYRAPELEAAKLRAGISGNLEDSKITVESSADVYCLGQVLLEIWVAGTFGLVGNHTDASLFFWLFQEGSQYNAGQADVIKTWALNLLPGALPWLVRGCLLDDPTERPTAHHVCIEIDALLAQLQQVQEQEQVQLAADPPSTSCAAMLSDSHIAQLTDGLQQQQEQQQPGSGGDAAPATEPAVYQLHGDAE